ncbi:hypothetical protein GQX74_011500 [Glossina fuscipes]|nr:hypothetical protein GQX74_011500 [Glossina fuscipes]
MCKLTGYRRAYDSQFLPYKTATLNLRIHCNAFPRHDHKIVQQLAAFPMFLYLILHAIASTLRFELTLSDVLEKVVYISEEEENLGKGGKRERHSDWPELDEWKDEPNLMTKHSIILRPNPVKLHLDLSS